MALNAYVNLRGRGREWQILLQLQRLLEIIPPVTCQPELINTFLGKLRRERNLNLHFSKFSQSGKNNRVWINYTDCS